MRNPRFYSRSIIPIHRMQWAHSQVKERHCTKWNSEQIVFRCLSWMNRLWPSRRKKHFYVMRNPDFWSRFIIHYTSHAMSSFSGPVSNWTTHCATKIELKTTVQVAFQVFGIKLFCSHKKRERPVNNIWLLLRACTFIHLHLLVHSLSPSKKKICKQAINKSQYLCFFVISNTL